MKKKSSDFEKYVYIRNHYSIFRSGNIDKKLSEKDQLPLYEIKNQVKLQRIKLAHIITFFTAILIYVWIREPEMFLFGDNLIEDSLVTLATCYLIFHWWLSKLIALILAEMRMEKKSAVFAKWVDSRNRKEVREAKKRKDAKKRAKEEREIVRKEKNRVRRIQQNDWGFWSTLGNLSSIKICYWCGAEENYQDFISGKVVRKEWKHMNANGTPDKRYNDNPLTVVFDGKFRCSNCDAINEYRHWCDKEPYEKGRAEIGRLVKKGIVPFNETKFLRDANTGEVLDNPNPTGDTAEDFELNSNCVKHKKPFMMR